MAFSISLKVSGVKELTTALDDWAAEVKAPKIFFTNLVSDVVAPHITQRFASQGPGWAALSPQYAAWKAVHFPGKPLLVRTGAMKAAMTDASRFGGAQSMVSGNSINLAPKDSTIARRFGYHQEGRGHNPKRMMIDMKELEAKVTPYASKWFAGRARDFGFKVTE